MPVDDKNIIELEDRTMSRKQRRFTYKRKKYRNWTIVYEKKNARLVFQKFKKNEKN